MTPWSKQGRPLDGSGSADQEVLCIYGTQMSSQNPPLDFILSQFNLVHTLYF
jgi:hypothetical protein